MFIFHVFKIIIRTFWIRDKADTFIITTRDIGRMLFDKLTLPFELISLLIVVSIIGAIMLVLFSKGEK